MLSRRNGATHKRAPHARRPRGCTRTQLSQAVKDATHAASEAIARAKAAASANAVTAAEGDAFLLVVVGGIRAGAARGGGRRLAQGAQGASRGALRRAD